MMFLAVGTIVFSVLQLVPGDPAALLLTQGGASASAEAIAALREQMGLNEPVLSQYLSFLSSVVQFDFGSSLIDGSRIAGLIGDRLPRTLELVAAALVIALALGVPAGTLAGLNPGGRFDRAATAAAVLLTAVPVFVVGTLFVWLFAQVLRVMPAGGYVAFAEDPLQHLKLLALPALSVSFNLIAIVFRMTRTSVLETRANDWVRTAIAKGLPRRLVVRRHILRNAMSPVITVVGMQVGILLGSTVLVEFVYNWPGLSGLLVSAVEQRDFPTVRAVILVVAGFFILINLGVELILSFLDPRIRSK